MLYVFLSLKHFHFLYRMFLSLILCDKYEYMKASTCTVRSRTTGVYTYKDSLRHSYTRSCADSQVRLSAYCTVHATTHAHTHISMYTSRYENPPQAPTSHSTSPSTATYLPLVPLFCLVSSSSPAFQSPLLSPLSLTSSFHSLLLLSLFLSLFVFIPLFPCNIPPFSCIPFGFFSSFSSSLPLVFTVYWFLSISLSYLSIQSLHNSFFLFPIILVFCSFQFSFSTCKSYLFSSRFPSFFHLPVL